jgi:hypothetical protein
LKKKSVTLRTLLGFFEIAIPSPWSSFSVASNNEISFFKQNYTKNEPGAQEKRKPVWQMKFSQLPFNAGLSWIVGPCDKCDGPHDASVCPLFQNKAREPHADALDMYEKNSVKRRRARAAADEARALRQALTATTTTTTTTTRSWSRLRRAKLRWRSSQAAGPASSTRSATGCGDARRARPPQAAFVVSSPNGSLLTVTHRWAVLADWVLWDAGTGVAPHARLMRESSAWSSAVELAPCAYVCGVEVHVHEPNGRSFMRIARFRPEGTDHRRKVVRIVYGGRCHYDGLQVT